MGLMITRDVTVRAIGEAPRDSTFTTKKPIKNLLKKKEKNWSLSQLKRRLKAAGICRCQVCPLQFFYFFTERFIKKKCYFRFDKKSIPLKFNIQLCVITVIVFPVISECFHEHMYVCVCVCPGSV